MIDGPWSIAHCVVAEFSPWSIVDGPLHIAKKCV